MSEVWEWVPGYIGYYQVSNMGRTRSVDRLICTREGKTRKLKGKITKQRHQRNGYLIAVFSRENKIENYLVHRLVATVFIGAPESKDMVVNHKNFNRADNRAINLEWTTQVGNMRYSRSNGRFPKDKRSKKIECSNGQTYESISSAAAILHLNRANLQMVLKGKRHHVHGLKFWFSE